MVRVALLAHLGSVSTMALEGARRAEFTEFVAHHVFGHVDTDEVLSVVHHESMTHEVWCDHRRACPCLDRFLLRGIVHLVDFPEKLLIDERSFFERAAHN